MNRIALSDDHNTRLRDSLTDIGSPYDDFEDFLASVYPVFASLPKEVLRKLFEFRNDPNAYGAMLLENFPIDEELPETPSDGRRSKDKNTFISEACVLGMAQILGQPVGYHDEREGEIVHSLCPVRGKAYATSSESYRINLGFHTDFNFDKEDPDQPYNVINPDYVILICLRADKKDEACTSYADVRDMCKKLTAAELDILRKPLFQFGASYSFTGKCGADKIWSVPSSLIKGPDRFPELSIDLLCGVRALSKEADGMLDILRELCELPDVASRVYLKPGDLFLMDNRKGAHARTAFTGCFDGYDRWLQRVYVRRSLWELRKTSNEALRVF